MDLYTSMGWVCFSVDIADISIYNHGLCMFFCGYSWQIYMQPVFGYVFQWEYLTDLCTTRGWVCFLWT